MLISLKRAVAYFCPYCSELTTITLSVFNLSGHPGIGLNCSSPACRKMVVTIAEKKDKYNISVECPICDETHSFKVSRKSFWNRPLIKLSCPGTKIGIFFAGTVKNVNDAVMEHERDIAALEEEDGDFLDDMIPAGDMQLVYSIADIIHQLAGGGKIGCVCKNREIEAGFTEECLVLSCPKCGKRAEIPISYDSLKTLSGMSSIILGKNI